MKTKHRPGKYLYDILNVGGVRVDSYMADSAPEAMAKHTDARRIIPNIAKPGSRAVRAKLTQRNPKGDGESSKGHIKGYKAAKAGKKLPRLTGSEKHVEAIVEGYFQGLGGHGSEKASRWLMKFWESDRNNPGKRKAK